MTSRTYDYVASQTHNYAIDFDYIADRNANGDLLQTQSSLIIEAISSDGATLIAQSNISYAGNNNSEVTDPTLLTGNQVWSTFRVGMNFSPNPVSIRITRRTSLDNDSLGALANDQFNVPAVNRILQTIRLAVEDRVAPVGPKGTTGNTGPQGDTGPQGPKGDAGNTGPAGQNGANGTNGEDGTNGTNGTGMPIVNWRSGSGAPSSIVQGSIVRFDNAGVGGSNHIEWFIAEAAINPSETSASNSAASGALRRIDGNEAQATAIALNTAKVGITPAQTARLLPTLP